MKNERKSIEKIAEFVEGCVYNHANGVGYDYECLGWLGGYPALMNISSSGEPLGYPFFVTSKNAVDLVPWSLKPKEEWVVLMWKTKHKDSVLVNSEFFTSEQSAINKWVEHPLYIGTKRVR